VHRPKSVVGRGQPWRAPVNPSLAGHAYDERPTLRCRLAEKRHPRSQGYRCCQRRGPGARGGKGTGSKFAVGPPTRVPARQLSLGRCLGQDTGDLPYARHRVFGLTHLGCATPHCFTGPMIASKGAFNVPRYVARDGRRETLTAAATKQNAVEQAYVPGAACRRITHKPLTFANNFNFLHS
jgi:hypothetical protein